jgi:hypothetical protein
MSTTTLFVELVVVGVGAMAWIALLVLAAFGHEWLPVDRLFSPAITVPMLALVYLLGIVTDRVADTMLGPLWARGNRLRVYGNDESAYAGDKLLVLATPQFSRLFEYNKSLQRICRGWTINAVAIFVALHALLWLRYGATPTTVRVAVLGSLLLLLLAAGCLFSARRLNAVQYRKIKEQAAMLRARQPAGTATGAVPVTTKPTDR